MRAEGEDRGLRKINGSCLSVGHPSDWAGAVGLAIAMLWLVGHIAIPARAEPVLDRALSGLRLMTTPSCVVVKIEFNFRVRYVSHFPIGTGDELRVSVRPIDPGQAAALAILRREALRAPESARAGIKAIDFEADQPSGPVLRVQFNHPVAYQVAQGPDFESIVVAIAGRTPRADCRPVFPSRIGTGWDATVVAENQVPPPPSAARPVPVARQKERPAGQLTEAEVRSVAASMDEARAAIRKGNSSHAVQLLTKVLGKPENEYSAEAQELLGVAYQKDGRSAEARGEYEDYLRRYPGGEGAERVSQRLDGILTATGESRERLRTTKAWSAETEEPGASRTRPTTWSVSGSASQFYIRDDSFRTLRDPSLPPDPNEDKDDHRVHQNALLSSLDLIAVMSNDQFKSKFRFSGTEEHGFSDDEEDTLSVAAFFFEITFREIDLMTRLGRQTRNTGGVLGRFDGGVVSWQASPTVRLNVVAGSPVDRRQDEPFKDDRYFYGVSADIGRIWDGLETTVFALEQRDRSFLDRQAVGAELRYIDSTKSAFATIDYDVHFQELNAAIFSGTWTLADKSTIQVGADYRKSPYLSAWNALQGQPFLTLYDLLRVHTQDEIDQLAIDRTPTYKSATIGYSLPLTDNLQLSFDATVANLSGTVASFGVDATPSSGDEYFYSAQLIGTSLLADGDLYIAGLRFADRETSDLYVLDLSARYPLTDEFRISPRLRLGYEFGNDTDLREFTVLPSVLLNYYWTKDLSFELEAGTRLTSREQGGAKEDETEFFLTVGFRYDFYADDQRSCLFVPTCR
jgi:hypothetical protein